MQNFRVFNDVNPSDILLLELAVSLLRVIKTISIEVTFDDTNTAYFSCPICKKKSVAADFRHDVMCLITAGDALARTVISGVLANSTVPAEYMQSTVNR